MIVRLQNLAWGISGLNFDINKSFHMLTKKSKSCYKKAIKLKHRAIRALYANNCLKIDAVIDKFKPSKIFSNGSFYTYKEFQRLDHNMNALSSKRILEILVQNCFPASRDLPEEAPMRAQEPVAILPFDEIPQARAVTSHLTEIEKLLVPYADIVLRSSL